MKQKAEEAVRKLGLYATYEGYFSLIDLVEALAEGVKYGHQLWVKTAEQHGVGARTLDTQFRRLMVYARRNSPEQWQDWFGTGSVSVKSFLQVLAAHIAKW